MEKENANPTLEDLAAHSGVSIATVSRVINASGPVSEDAERRVKQAIDALGFEPKRKRRRVRNKPPLLACIVPEFMNPANTMIMTGVQEEAEKMVAHVLMVPVSEKPGSLHSNLHVFRYMNIDGIILAHVGVKAEEILDVCKASDLPLIVLRRDVATHHVFRIDVDRENGMYQAAKLLIGLNHTDIAYLCGSADSDFAHSKLRGIQRALTEAELTLRPELHRVCLPTVDDGFRVATNLLHLPPDQRPTAIITYNDLVAIGTLHAIRSAGLRVPEDISVVGFDNIPLSSHTNPPLTTVAQPHYQKGQMAVQTIVNRLTGEDDTDPEGFTLLACSLVVRESTGPCPPSV
jgi:DNA-binding LacI/PurR family transcriptional regulator